MSRATPAPALVIQTAFLGDVVLTTPLLAALAARHGPVDVVTTPGAAPLLETHAAVRRVIPFDKKGADRGLGGLWRLARRLRAERYGIATAFVALAPGSIWGSKRWPYYPALAVRLAAQMPVVVVGGPEDAVLGEAIVEMVAA